MRSRVLAFLLYDLDLYMDVLLDLFSLNDGCFLGFNSCMSKVLLDLGIVRSVSIDFFRIG